MSTIAKLYEVQGEPGFPCQSWELVNEHGRAHRSRQAPVPAAVEARAAAGEPGTYHEDGAPYAGGERALIAHLRKARNSETD